LDSVIIHHLQSKKIKISTKFLRNHTKRTEYHIAAQYDARTIVAGCAKCPTASRRDCDVTGKKKKNDVTGKNTIKNWVKTQ
jgi:Leu/Phe-tRNA-protein transferase